MPWRKTTLEGITQGSYIETAKEVNKSEDNPSERTTSISLVYLQGPRIEAQSSGSKTPVYQYPQLAPSKGEHPKKELFDHLRKIQGRLEEPEQEINDRYTKQISSLKWMNHDEIAKLLNDKESRDAVFYFLEADKEISEEDRIAIAKSWASSGDFSAQYIKKFGIKDQNALIEIAQLCATKNAIGTSQCFQEFGIKDQNARIEIAKLCAMKDGGATAQNIGSFWIKSKHQIELMEIAKLCAKQNCKTTAYHIGKFNIQLENDRIDIAKFCAMQPDGATAYFIKSFCIENQQALIEIAKLCAMQNGGPTAQHIRDFGIKDQNALIQIAKLCARQDPFETSNSIQNFGFEESIRNLIFSLCIFSDPDIIKFSRFEINSKPNQKQLFFHLKSLLDPLKTMKKENPSLEELSAFIQSHIDPDSPLFDQITKCLTQIKDVYALAQASRWIACMLFFFSALNQTEQEQVIKSDLFENLLSIQSPILRQNLSTLLVEFAFSPNAFKIYLEEQSELDSKIGKHSAKISKGKEKKEVVKAPSKQAKEKKILDFMLGALQIAGISKETTDNIKSIFSLVFKGRAEIRPLLEMLYLLNSSILLSAEEKENVLQLLCEGAIKGRSEKGQEYNKRLAELKPVLKQRTFALLAILFLKNEPLLPKSSSFLECVSAAIQEKLHFDLNGINFITFQEHFMTQRNPSALFTYAAKLFSLNDPIVIDELSRYVHSVMDGSFIEERYKLENNPHLKKVHDQAPELVQNWQSPLKRVNRTFSAEDTKPFDPLSWLKNKADHHHMEPNLLPNLDALLRNELIDENMLSPIEKALKKLLESKDKKSQISSLESIKEELSKLSPCEFKNDVNSQLDSLNQLSSSSSEEVQVVDTDDYLDLLLCGTEVIGSCQNVNGSPHLNRGLLGYILDGKNRLIAVKDKQGKIIARAKLSLLLNDRSEPVLYLESIYDQGKFTQQCLEAIVDMALEKAKSLKIPLAVGRGSNYLKLDQVDPEPFPSPLYSLGGGVSYEYVDACRGVQSEGIYTIDPYMIYLLDRP